MCKQDKINIKSLFEASFDGDSQFVSRLSKKQICFLSCVFVVLVFLGGILVFLFADNKKNEYRLAAENVSLNISNQVDQLCFRTFSINSTVADLILLDQKNIEKFQSISERILPSYAAADCIQIAPNGVVSAVFPLKGNENVLGHDLFADSARSSEAIKTRESGIMTIGGPYSLRQGGEGFIGRYPVFLDKEKKNFWGFVIVVVRISKFFDKINFTIASSHNFLYSVYKIEDDSNERKTIYGAPIELLKNPVCRKIDFPNSNWVLAIAPKTSWYNKPEIIAISIIDFVFVLIFTFLIYLLFVLRLRNLKLHQIASLDQLTGLYSRQTASFILNKEVDYAQRNDSQVAICFIDMNDFKHINDTYGHGAGDIALKKVASRLLEAVRPEDIVARFGGDEFIVILRGKKTGTNYQSTLERIESLLKVPAKISNHVQVDISASVGLAVYPQDGKTGEELLKYADFSMYQNKSLKKR